MSAPDAPTPPRTLGRRAALPAVLAALLASSLPPSAPAQAPQPQDARAWRAVEALVAEAHAASQPYDQRAPRWRALADALRDFVALYPGAAQRDQAARLELEALFQLGCLAGGDLRELRARAAEYERNPPGPDGACEAAYWSLIVRIAELPLPESQPTIADFGRLDPRVVREYSAFVQGCPAHRHAPRLVEHLFEDALRRSEPERVRPLVAGVVAAWPADPVAQRIEAALRREDATGRPFRVQAVMHSGDSWDSASAAGRVIALVVWSSADPESMALVREVDAVRRVRSDLEVVGVNLDESPASMRAAIAELGIDWPQWNDGNGRAHEFVRAWGLGGGAWVMVIGPDGVLRGASRDAGWRDLTAPVDGD